MNIDDLTIGEARKLAAMFPHLQDASAGHPYPVGSSVFVQTVTWAYTGRLAQVTDREFVLEDAARIFETGRFGEAMRTGKLSELEPFPDGSVIVTREGSEVSIWAHPLPREAM